MCSKLFHEDPTMVYLVDKSEKLNINMKVIKEKQAMLNKKSNDKQHYHVYSSGSVQIHERITEKD